MVDTALRCLCLCYFPSNAVADSLIVSLEALALLAAAAGHPNLVQLPLALRLDRVCCGCSLRKRGSKKCARTWARRKLPELQASSLACARAILASSGSWSSGPPILITRTSYYVLADIVWSDRSDRRASPASFSSTSHAACASCEGGSIC